MSINIRNTFGNGEMVSGISKYGVESGNDFAEMDTLNPDKQSSLQFNFKKPILADPDDLFEVSIYKLHHSHLHLQSYQDTKQGISIFRSLLKDNGLYKVGYHGIWRENLKLAPDAPLSVRWDAGHSLKSSLFHEYSIDTRNDLVFPVNGIMFKVYQELAGLGGNVNFFKTEVQGSKSIFLNNCFVIIVNRDCHSLAELVY